MAVSLEAEQVLKDIIDNEDMGNYWHNRFEKLNRKDDTILRGYFEELEEAGLISVTWADDIPYYIQVLKDRFLREIKL